MMEESTDTGTQTARLATLLSQNADGPEGEAISLICDLAGQAIYSFMRIANALETIAKNS
jgi:hypothetical protein